MFIRMDGVIYLEIQSNYFKLCNFISSWKIVKNTIKLAEGYFSTKLTETCKENQGWNVLCIRGYDVNHIEFKTL